MKKIIPEVLDAAREYTDQDDVQFIAGFQLSDGTAVTYGVLDETDNAFVCLREGGRMDYVPKSSIVSIRLDTLDIRKHFVPVNNVDYAQGPKVER